MVGRSLRLNSTEDRDALVRERLSRIAEELREVLDEMPSDLRAQVAIASAMAFVQLVLDRHLAEERPTDRVARPLGIVPPPEAP
ncbi:MAG: hypothetical protein WEB59_05600 [Thermoanaerobaculia bacterium]